jgi:N-acetylneuraminic acid mutarotase
LSAYTWFTGFTTFNGKGFLFADNSSVLEYDPIKIGWTSHSHLGRNIGLAGVSTVQLDGKAYILDKFGIVKYDLTSHVSSIEKPMNTWRNYMGAAAINGKIYAMGGTFGPGSTSKLIEMYDPASDTWSFGPEMPLARSLFATAVLDGKVYLIGGQTTVNGMDVPIRNVDRYDPVTETWESLFPLPFPIAGASATVVKDKIILMGGKDGNTVFNNVFEFKP